MAPRRERPIASTKNKLVRESQKSLTNFPQEVFNAWQNAGRFPRNFKNFDELVSAYNASIAGGMTPAEAREDLGINFNAFKKQGDEYILDRRIIRTELDPWTEELIDLSSGSGSGKLEAKRQRREFTFGEAATQAKAAEQNLFMPRAVRAKIYYDKGHGRAAANALSPGSDDIENVLPEIAQINQLHKEKDRYPQWFMEEAGIPVSKPEAYFNRQIIEQGAPRRSGLSGPIAQPILDSLDRLIYDRAMYISKVTNKTPYDVWETATDLDTFPHLNESYNIKSYGQALAAADKAEQGKAITGEYPEWVNELAGTTSRGASSGGPVRKNYSVSKAPNIDVSNVKLSDAPPGIGRVIKPVAAAAGLLPGIGAVLDLGDVYAGTQQTMGSQSKQQQGAGALKAASGALGIASLAAPVLAPAAMAISGVSALADRRAAMENASKPNYSVSGKPAQIIPTRQLPPSKPIGTGQGGLTKPKGAMPKSKPLDLPNEAQYFIVNPIRSAFSKVFGNRGV